MAAEGDLDLDLVVLGLDKGSSATGAMFQYKAIDCQGEVDKHKELVRLDGKAFKTTGKTTSGILYKDNDNGGFTPDCFGDMALSQRHKRSDRYYVEGDKRKLHDPGLFWDKVVSADQAFADHTAMVIRAAFRQFRHKNLHKRHLRAVMTMPSQTSSSVIKIMLDALQNAVRSASPYHAENPDRFTILFVTEPTAVMLQTFFQSAQTQGDIPDGVISIYDLGGGTSDICFYLLSNTSGKWEANETVKEQGILSGGMKIDEAFFAAVERREPEAWKLFKEETEYDEGARDEYKWFWERWLEAKISYSSGPLRIYIPAKLKRKTRNRAPDEEGFVFTETEANAIFDNALDPICAAIERNPGAFPYITGGMSLNPYCQERIRRLIPHVKVVEGEDLVVCEGALIYGWNPHLIASRVLQRSYGVLYDHLVDDPDLPAHKARYARRVRPLKIFSPSKVDLELYTRAVRLGATVDDKVDTSHWYKVQTIWPSKVADSTITFDVIAFDTKVTGVMFDKHHGTSGDNKVLLLPELPRTGRIKFKHEARIPEDLRQRVATKMDVYMQFRADGVKLKLEFTNECVQGNGQNREQVRTVTMTGGT